MAVDISLSTGGDFTIVTLGDHWVDLANYTTSVQNILARPGTFTTLFPETTSDDLVALLQDGLAECHLEFTLLGFESDDNGLVRPTMTSGQIALVILYAGIRMMRGELLNRVTSSKYTAGPVTAEISYSTNVLRDIIKDLEAQKVFITRLYASSGANSFFQMDDAYIANAFNSTPNGVPLASWLPVAWGWPWRG
jgi:hypothetical protein